jgi:[protein-PII] uridylyltransferase
VPLSLPRPEKFEIRLQKRAERLRLADPAIEGAERLARFRKYLEQTRSVILRYHRQGGRGRRVAQLRSVVIDVAIACLFRLALETWERSGKGAPPECAILALGGYGRQELCPFSDIDIMFLYPHRCRATDLAPFQRHLSDTVLYPLWDLGMKVGHSSRNSPEAIAEAQAEVQSKNALMEARRIAGNVPLAEKFFKEYDRYIRRDDARVYIDERLKDQRARRKRHGDTVFLQEPDLKNGVGGLRDFQNILWMTRLEFGIDRIDVLTEKGILRKNEQLALEDAYDFLLRVRSEVHFQSRRPTDLLDLEKQPRVAWNLGYRQRDIFKRVEALMRDVYMRAQKIFRLSNYIEQRLALETRHSVSFSAVLESRRERRHAIDGFVIQGGVISAAGPRVFAEDPVRLLRVFRHVQQLKVRWDFELVRLIEENVHLIDEKVIESEEANRCFRSILQTKGEVYPALRKMNNTGVLSRFLPEWTGLHCLVQHEFYHRYTADEHTLLTIRELDSVFSGDEVGITEKYREALLETNTPALLYIILLLHDIGKGDAIKGHAERGAEMAGEILRRLRVVPEIQPKIVLLIRIHLEMARYWQHFDLDDLRTIKAFANLVGDGETLRFLYALTFCDARGTAGGLWNSYKDSLHTHLFDVTRRQMGEGAVITPRTQMITKETLLGSVPGLSDEEIEAHYNLLPERYFVYSNKDEVTLHLRMVNELLRTIAASDSIGSLIPVVEWQDDVNLGLSVVHIVTWDRAGLFYKLAGAFSVAGLSIVSSKALTRADHITIDTFYISDPDGGIVSNQKARQTFQHYLEEALLHNRDLLPEIERQASRLSKPAFLQKDEQLRAPLPAYVEVYHELSLRRTIIEIQATDAIGLLYRLTRAIYEHGFDITFARISTERHVAVDTFYIEPVDPNVSNDAANLVSLRERLNEIVQSVSAPAEV